MTSLTIELTPDIYARLRAEAQRQGKAEQLLAQELLTGQLLSAGPVEVPLYIHMLPHIRALAATLDPAVFIVPGTATPQEAITLLQAWSDEEATEADDDAKAWEDVLRAIDANRMSYRKLFPHLEQPE